MNSGGMPRSGSLWIHLSFNPPQFDLYAIHGVRAIPDHGIGIFSQGKGAAELQGFDPSRNVAVKQSAELAAFMGAEFELVAGFHAYGTVSLSAEHFCNYFVTDLRIIDVSH